MAGPLLKRDQPERQPTAAEQLHHGRINLRPERSSGALLLLDLDRCSAPECRECKASCSYFYHPENQGTLSLRELATYHLICRRCEDPHCVTACPHQALEQQTDRDRLLIRHTARCVSCRSCSHACPYGTILPEFLDQNVSNCDFCLARTNGDLPLCVQTCENGSLRLLRESEELGENTSMVGDHLAVHSIHWKQEKA